MSIDLQTTLAHVLRYQGQVNLTASRSTLGGINPAKYSNSDRLCYWENKSMGTLSHVDKANNLVIR